MDGMDGMDGVDGVDGMDGVDGVDGMDGVDGVQPRYQIPISNLVTKLHLVTPLSWQLGCLFLIKPRVDSHLRHAQPTAIVSLQQGRT